MGQVKKEVENAIKALGLTENDIRLLDTTTGRQVYTECLAHFVKTKNRRWWWEDFKQPSFSFRAVGNPFEMLNEVMPETDGNVWLIVEDNEEPFYPVYDTKPAIIKDLVGECFLFEYYIIDKNKEWLLCENHHNHLIGVGDKLKAINLDKLNI